MTALDRRAYTDRQVRENAELMAFAVGYAGAYEGDFEFLVKARQYVEREGALPVQVARGVLNCARHDLNVAGSLPEPGVWEPGQAAPYGHGDGLGHGEDGVVVPMRRKPRKRPQEADPEPEPQRRWTVAIPARVKVGYALPPNGYRIHVLDLTRGYFYDARGPEVLWYPTDHWSPGWRAEPQLYVQALCAWKGEPVLLRSPDQAPEYELCRTCLRIVDDRDLELP